MTIQSKRLMKKQKLYAILLILGAGILLFRTIRLLSVENGWTILANWVIVFTFIEMAIDLACIMFAFHWLLKNSQSSKPLALRFGAAAAIFHAFRVLIYVLGRIGPWTNFDVKEQYQSEVHYEMFWVYFASILSVLGIIGVIVIWRIMKRKKI